MASALHFSISDTIVHRQRSEPKGSDPIETSHVVESGFGILVDDLAIYSGHVESHDSESAVGRFATGIWHSDFFSLP